MPRQRKTGDDGREVKKRSRNGCWPCKSRKVKCGEEKPACGNCQRAGEECDYSIRLNWDGRNKKKDVAPSFCLTHESPPINEAFNPASPALFPAPNRNLSSPNKHDVVSSRHSSGASSEQLPPISNLTSAFPGSLHPPQPPPILRFPTWSEPKTSVGQERIMPPLRQTISYPSPAETALGSPLYSTTFPYTNPTLHMPPPTSHAMLGHDAVASPYNNAKRMKMSPRSDHSNRFTRVEDAQSRYFNPSTPTYFSTIRDPLTPTLSQTSHGIEEDRRISVNSLLSDPNEEQPSRKTSSNSYPQDYDQRPQESLRRGSLHQTAISYVETELYGFDRGAPDYDLGRNNDYQAIQDASTPSDHSDFASWLGDQDLPFGFACESREQAFNSGGYYASAVPIRIPKILEPLPSTLTSNPMNLLYFHHFLNHTARILVPHDCPENPFKTILPSMAIRDENLLNLMLAYSACHRSRLLNHKMPEDRIAHWVRNVFPSLRQDLAGNGTEQQTPQDVTLAKAIMLTSLEIISPSSFGVSVPWQAHLGLARSIVKARGGPHSVSRKEPVMYFLSRWLAYLDVFGALSNRINDDPLFEGNYWSSNLDSATPGSGPKELSLTDDDDHDDDDYTIDCLLGFTTRCIYILANIASLARQCAPFRLNAQTGVINAAWRPSTEIRMKADKLKADLEKARQHELRQCHHHSPVLAKANLSSTPPSFAPYPSDASQPIYAPPPSQAREEEVLRQEATETIAINEIYHWAGLVHLLRRVYNVPRESPEVQSAVSKIMDGLHKLRIAGSGEACSLFPIFTAGVETVRESDRWLVLERLKGAEGLGMCQVARARAIVEEVGRRGGECGWEGLVGGDFFG